MSGQCIAPVCLTVTVERDGEAVSFNCVSALCSSAARAARTTCGLDAPMTRTARPARFRCPYGASPADRHAANWMPILIPQGFNRLRLDACQFPACLSATQPGRGLHPPLRYRGLGPFFRWGEKYLAAPPTVLQSRGRDVTPGATAGALPHRDAAVPVPAARAQKALRGRLPLRHNISACWSCATSTIGHFALLNNFRLMVKKYAPLRRTKKC